jgi:hypothetical protein
MKSREPSDLARSKEVTVVIFCKQSSRRERVVDSRQRGPLDLLLKFHFGVSWVEGPKLRRLDS